MINAQMSYFDMAVIAIMALSCLLAFYRGFVKEVLSLGAWMGAALVTIYYFQDLAIVLRPHFKNDMVSGGLAALALYVASLLTFSVVNSIILKLLKEGGDVGLLDNSLGLGFGAIRGAFVISLGFFLLTMFLPENEEDHPEWIRKAVTVKYVEKGALLLARSSPEYLRKLSPLNKKIEREDENAREPRGVAASQKQSYRNRPERETEHKRETGYSLENSREMQRLLQASPAR